MKYAYCPYCGREKVLTEDSESLKDCDFIANMASSYNKRNIDYYKCPNCDKPFGVTTMSNGLMDEKVILRAYIHLYADIL